MNSTEVALRHTASRVTVPLRQRCDRTSGTGTSAPASLATVTTWPAARETESAGRAVGRRSNAAHRLTALSQVREWRDHTPSPPASGMTRSHRQGAGQLRRVTGIMTLRSGARGAAHTPPDPAHGTGLGDPGAPSGMPPLRQRRRRRRPDLLAMCGRSVGIRFRECPDEPSPESLGAIAPPRRRNCLRVARDLSPGGVAATSP